MTRQVSTLNVLASSQQTKASRQSNTIAIMIITGSVVIKRVEENIKHVIFDLSAIVTIV
jgi:hypothetical protein